MRDVGRQARAVWAGALVLSALTTVVLVTGAAGGIGRVGRDEAAQAIEVPE